MKTKRFGWMIGLAAVVLAVAGSVFSGASAAQWIPDSSEDGTWIPLGMATMLKT